ncbi:hypothetical protein [Streptomyces erythrochromogenes]
MTIDGRTLRHPAERDEESFNPALRVESGYLPADLLRAAAPF